MKKLLNTRPTIYLLFFVSIISTVLLDRNCRITYKCNLVYLFLFLGDIGGSLGLFIGASVMTLFEIFDLLGTYVADRKLKRKG